MEHSCVLLLLRTAFPDVYQLSGCRGKKIGTYIYSAWRENADASQTRDCRKREINPAAFTKLRVP